MKYHLSNRKPYCYKLADFFFYTDKIRLFLLIVTFSCLSLAGYAQDPTPDTSKMLATINDISRNGGEFLTIQQCIDYALVHQPGLNQTLINQSITRETNAIALSSWLPQVNATGSGVHYIQQSNYSSATTGTGTSSSSTATKSSAANSFIPELAVSQAIFSPSLLFAAKSAPLLITQSKQITDSTKIYLVSAVSKSFYNVLLTLEQINVLKEDTARLGKNLRDAYHQYKGGIVDETDYEEAAISLNNSKASLKQANETVVPQYAVLKRLMGYPPEKQFNVNFDTLQMAQSINVDTTQQLAYEKRIEYQQLKTQKDIQNEQIKYYRTSFLPTVSAFYNYDLAYENSRVSNLFSNSYPSQLIGVSISIPIFTGLSRIHSLHRAKLQEEVLNWSEVDLKSQIYSEYTSALGSYKSNLYNLKLLQQNVTLAKRTYFVVTLQYKQGIVAYLNVITAESNLISSEISYLNALFQTLSSKIDLQKAMGNITY
ncbi:Outer membrane protein TolC [Mucilaginibacter mallensis]|uniref:Outer membrane protein TolC n=1 Tax=Mucilaginibacter mallensis TaxID=652787 RepID=A0A1H1VZ62_MUCMA|nr:TolC family protein [Mucilaginibacter mallensis]SDS90063.1 Outer membrane protein TolC [Mucilaginibacter mallensis]